MTGRGSQTEAPRAALPRLEVHGDAAIFWTAFVISTLFVVGQIGFVVTVTPVMISLFGDSGSSLPPLLPLAASLGPIGIIAVLGALDLVLFFGFAAFSRRTWIGMLFVPPLLYLGSGAALFALWWPAAVGLLP